MKVDENPFLRWSLPHSLDLTTLTKALKARSRRLPPSQREELQEDWRRLTSEDHYRGRAFLLTPPAGIDRDPLDLAQALLSDQTTPTLPPLQASLEDALLLPSMSDEILFANPPFLTPLRGKK